MCSCLQAPVAPGEALWIVTPTTGSVINGLTSSRHKQSIFFLKPSRKHLGNKTQNYCVSNVSVMCYYKKHLLSVEKIKYLFACTGGITVRNVPRVRTPGAETPWDSAITPSVHTAFLPCVSQVSKRSVSSWTAHIGHINTEHWSDSKINHFRRTGPPRAIYSHCPISFWGLDTICGIWGKSLTRCVWTKTETYQCRPKGPKEKEEFLYYTNPADNSLSFLLLVNTLLPTQYRPRYHGKGLYRGD